MSSFLNPTTWKIIGIVLLSILIIITIVFLVCFCEDDTSTKKPGGTDTQSDKAKKKEIASPEAKLSSSKSSIEIEDFNSDKATSHNLVLGTKEHKEKMSASILKAEKEANEKKKKELLELRNQRILKLSGRGEAEKQITSASGQNKPPSTSEVSHSNETPPDKKQSPIIGSEGVQKGPLTPLRGDQDTTISDQADNSQGNNEPMDSIDPGSSQVSDTIGQKIQEEGNAGVSGVSSSPNNVPP